MNTKTETKTSTSHISFYRYLKDGTPNPDIKRAFLDNLVVTAQDAVEGKLRTADGSVWTLVLEPEVQERLREQHTAICLVSFQLRTRGAYAVARLYVKREKHVRRDDASKE